MSSSLRNTYDHAKARCLNPRDAAFKNYVGRGIKFLFQNFEEFLSCLGPRPKGKMLDRIDNNGHYEPGNVKWSTRKQQNENKRQYKRREGTRGTCFSKRKAKTEKPWVAQISTAGRNIGLGYFK